MKKIKVAVLFGGVSSEYEVSLNSAFNVISNLSKEKFEIIPIGITKNGHWLYYPGPIEKIPTDQWKDDLDCCPAIISPDSTHGGILKIMENFKFALLKIDCVFPVLHGSNGEDGRMQGLLEMSGIPYVGCDVLSSAVCMDKVLTRVLLDYFSVKGTKWRHINKKDIEKLDSFCESISKSLQFPIFTKPANAGSSVGISKCHNIDELRHGILVAFAHDDKVLCEAGVDGKEIECAVIGNSEPKASIPGQIVPCNEFYDYDAKYESDSRLEIPAPIDEKTSQEIKNIAIKAYKLLGCSGFARIDFFVTNDTNDIYLNEINTIPGFTKISMYPKLWAQEGVKYSELLENLIELAIKKNNN